MTIDNILHPEGERSHGQHQQQRAAHASPARKNCDQIETTCDYFAGEIDYIKIETS